MPYGGRPSTSDSNWNEREKLREICSNLAPNKDRASLRVASAFMRNVGNTAMDEDDVRDFINRRI